MCIILITLCKFTIFIIISPESRSKIKVFRSNHFLLYFITIDEMVKYLYLYIIRKNMIKLNRDVSFLCKKLVIDIDESFYFYLKEFIHFECLIAPETFKFV